MRKATLALLWGGAVPPWPGGVALLTCLANLGLALVPGHSNVLPRDVDTSTRLTRNLRLNVPILSAAMDTVTEARLAIVMAQCGGIGIIHKNMTPDQQAAEVRLVKKFEAGVIRDPLTVRPDTSIRDVLRGHLGLGVPHRMVPLCRRPLRRSWPGSWPLC